MDNYSNDKLMWEVINREKRAYYHRKLSGRKYIKKPGHNIYPPGKIGDVSRQLDRLLRKKHRHVSTVKEFEEHIGFHQPPAWFRRMFRRLTRPRLHDGYFIFSPKIDQNLTKSFWELFT